MSKVKRMLAVVLAMVMVLAMNIVSFAANGTAEISVSGLASTGTNTVTCYKILTPDVTVTESGYKFSFVNGIQIGGYADAKSFLEAGVEAQKDALNSTDLSNFPQVTTGTITGTTWTANVEAGYYAVFIQNTGEEGDPAITYMNPMIVSVEYKNAALQGDGSYEYDAVATDHSSVVAKYTTIPVTKEVTSEESQDGAIAIGTTQTYKIETYIPSQVATFTLTDHLTGAIYDKDSVVVQIVGVEGNLGEVEGVVTYAENGDMVITLDNYLSHAGKMVTVTYRATATATMVGNEVIPDDGVHDFTPATTVLYTGAITLTKFGNESEESEGTGTDQSGKTRILLAGAVYTIKDANGNVLKFTKHDDGMYYLDPVNGSERVTTGTDGTLTVIGLDLGIYTFTEVQAPEGYSINTNEVTAEITSENTTEKPTLVPATTEMIDTTLSALPSTGGVGITIFTIVGCLIMIAAASMYFMGRRKNEE